MAIQGSALFKITCGAVVVMLVINVFTSKESHLFSENPVLEIFFEYY